MASLAQISDKVKTSGITQIELTPAEVGLIVQTLVYDGRIEQVRGPMSGPSGEANVMYKATKTISTYDRYIVLNHLSKL